MLVDAAASGFETLAPQPRAALLIVHGLAEYAGRYRDIAATLAARGISCFAYDQRGHGAQPGTRTHVDRFDDFVDDLNLAAESLRRRSPELPLFVWGHSMGSIVVICAVLSARHRWRGAITTSNSLEVFRRGPNPLNPFFRLAARVAPTIRVPLGLDPRKISTDEAVQRAYGSDPLIPPTASLRLIVEFAAACERCRESAQQLTLPWLVVHGEEDAIAPAQGSRLLFDALQAQDKQLVIYPGLRHEVHNERAAERARFIDLLSSWILART
ncbi:MAG TPA: lysophospholipase [Steroidobacteraceae bacterium]|nr:lysophospholipase [Steroidobacteraceae bacterium]